MSNLFKAVEVDGSEISVWYKIGLLAIKLCNYPLAQHAFEQVNLCVKDTDMIMMIPLAIICKCASPCAIHTTTFRSFLCRLFPNQLRIICLFRD